MGRPQIKQFHGLRHRVRNAGRNFFVPLYMYGLDLFSGIGGLTKALEPWVRPVAYCENDRYATGILLSRMEKWELPTAPIWNDVRTLKASDVKSPVEIVYGGPPCQPWSSAGKRRGKSDERNMWPEALRIVEEFRPSHCFFENVDELAADPYLIEIVERLETLGYFVPWPLIIAASDVGAPHGRDRIWIAAHLAGESMGIAGQPRLNGRVEPITDLDTAGLPLFQRRGATAESYGRAEPDSDDWWAVEPDVGRVVYGLPHRMDRIKCLGNAVVPAQAREAFRCLMGL